jgi:hypothetical protein
MTTMYKTRIISYMERTSPETAFEANTSDGIKSMIVEAIDEIEHLLSAKETAESLGLDDLAKEIYDASVFAGKWVIKLQHLARKETNNA